MTLDVTLPGLAIVPAGERPWAEPSTRGRGMDEAAFDELYATAYRRLVAQIYTMCGNLAEAQDCVQEAFIRAWDRRRTLDPDSFPEAWVRTVAYRLAVSRWRSARRGLRRPDRAYAASVTGEPDIARLALVQALQQLPLAQRRAIVLHHLCDLPVAEVALETNVPVGTVKARLARGRAALAELLADDRTEDSRRG